MCNLYRMTKAQAEVAALFSAGSNTQLNAAEEIYPGYPGMVVAEGEVRAMVWGFPLVLKSKKTGEPLKPKPVNNTRTDKLDSYMWRFSFAERRCLIPLTAWAEAEGPKGKMTRTWLSLPDADLFAVAGIWRDSDEWGACYSMIMTDAGGRAAEVHNRMPVILQGNAIERWQSGSQDEARALCSGYAGEIEIDRTKQLWNRRSA
ncbi:SOS response-associated peptidase [Croceicoccus marinus]|uniref:Abasic site processing protein n=1 Tax=Croceicoccus marinus TaxID=450378 RepID=A0A7G6W197_9SPHN|nr:SOS response-associated peptidase family protein [Croceicoccus marinus]QNE07762.1 SOS response-associated peptidase family protein [Croceicoccus marinus]